MSETKSFYIYMMANVRRGVLYVGVTSDLPNRGYQHRNGLIEGFTRRYGLRTLVWHEWHADAREAIAREKRVKRWRRAWKFELVEKMNPEWLDLWPELVSGREFVPETDYSKIFDTPILSSRPLEPGSG